MHYVESIREEPLTFLYFDYNYYHIQILTCRFRRWLSGAIRYFNSCVSVCNTVNIFPRKIFSPVRHSPTLFQEFFPHALKLFQEQNSFFFQALGCCSLHTNLFMMKIVFNHNFSHIPISVMVQKRNHTHTHTHKTEREREKIPRK